MSRGHTAGEPGWDARPLSDRAAEPEKPVICWRCSRPLPPEAKFCGYCGTRQSVTDDIPEPSR